MARITPSGPPGTSGGSGGSQTGLLASMQATGTGSKAFYFATDDNGGTLYQDLTNGAAYTKVAPGVTQPSGIELGYIEMTTADTTTAAAASPVAFTTDLTLTVANQTRPILVHGQALGSNSTAAASSAIYIGGSTNATLYSRAVGTSSTAAANVPLQVFKRFDAGQGTLVLRLYKSMAGGGIATFAGNTTPTFLRVVTL